jgi:tetratricopeptide (TPR) repeat protein
MQQGLISGLAESHRTYYNPYGEGSPAARENWINFQNQATLARYHADSVGAFIERTSRDQIVALDRATQQIDGTLVRGFTEVSDRIKVMTQQQERSNALLDYANKQLGQLRDIGSQTNKLLGGVNQRLEMLSFQQEATNMLLGNVAELLRVPDSQKQRQHHVELGMKFVKNASKDADLYHDALKEFLSAEQLMTSDYFVLRQIGMLYLYALPLIDLEKAADYLSRAGKYSSVESDSDSVRLEYVLAKSVSSSFGRQRNASSKDIALFASEAYRHAATAQYVLGKYESALGSIEKAIRLNSEGEDLRFFRAKYLAALMRSDEALNLLSKLIVTKPLVDAVFSDLDLARDVAAKWKWELQLQEQIKTRKVQEELRFAAKLRQEEAKKATLLGMRMAIYGPEMRRSGLAEDQIIRLLAKGGKAVVWVVCGEPECGSSWEMAEGANDVVALEIAHSYILALRSTGAVEMWVGGGKIIPIDVSDAVSIAVSCNFAAALRIDGTIVTWLGDGDRYIQRVDHVGGIDGIISIKGGDGGFLALKDNGTVIGVMSTRGDRPFIKIPSGLQGVGSIEVSSYNADLATALKLDGTIVTWGGKNEYGECNVPLGLKEVVDVSIGGIHSVALRKDGSVVAFGDNRLKQCSVPKNLQGVVSVKAGTYGTLALKGDGTVVTWGPHIVARGRRANREISSAVAIAASNHTYLVLLEDGELLVFGDKDFGMRMNAPKKIIGAVKIMAGNLGRVGAALLIDPYSKAKKRFVTSDELEAELVARDEMERSAKRSILLEKGDLLRNIEQRKKFWQSKDYTVARKLYQQAAELGSEEAKKRLKELPR